MCELTSYPLREEDPKAQGPNDYCEPTSLTKVKLKARTRWKIWVSNNNKSSREPWFQKKTLTKLIQLEPRIERLLDLTRRVVNRFVCNIWPSWLTIKFGSDRKKNLRVISHALSSTGTTLFCAQLSLLPTKDWFLTSQFSFRLLWRKDWKNLIGLPLNFFKKLRSLGKPISLLTQLKVGFSFQRTDFCREYSRNWRMTLK